ncbi:MAG: hypothetical protein ACI8V2_005433, partial [Candidatus Latescibacterota bacterium]
MRYILLCLTLLFCMCPVQAQQPTQIQTMDTPNDAGGSITLTWNRADLPPKSVYKIAIGESPNGPFYLAT